MIPPKRTKREKLKILLSPIRYAKKWYWVWLFTWIYDWFQSVFTVQIGARIIWAIEKWNIPSIKYYVGLLAITFILTYILRWVSEMSSEPVWKLIHLWLQKKYLGKYIHLDNTWIESFWTGKMNNIIFEGIGNWAMILKEPVVDICIEFIAIIYAFVLVANKAPNIWYFLGFLWLFLLNALFMFIGLGVLNSTRRKSKEIAVEMSRKQIKILMSKFEILQNNKLNEEMVPIEQYTQQIIKLWQRGNTRKTLRQLWWNGILDGMQITIYLIIGIGVVNWNYTFAYLMLLIQLLGILSKYTWNIRSYFKEYYKAMIHVDKLLETFDIIPIHREKPDAKTFIPKSESIEIKKVSFSYAPKAKIFSNFSLRIAWWKKTALVWPSGWWKTTLIKLIAWYVRPNLWTIVVDWQILEDLSFKSYYQNIGYLNQDPSVFDGTIYENLIHAIDKEEIKKRWFATKLKKTIIDARCEFVYAFKDGIYTEIWERWIRLSGGQKQRLAIAKIMLKNPNIVLLDEPTSALDSFNEDQIAQALNNLFKWKTVITVAHRLQTVKSADMIHYIAWGKIIESWTHAQLSKSKGEYAKMLELQTAF